ncbi:MAG TPA: ATP-binding protein [Pyrinomonadaceae bacterium]|nr:ATP-binding protein [Pyrinomonadaceae bacterium]
MKLRQFFNSFRVRLLLLLMVLLGLTLGVQYYVNLRAVEQNAHMIREQEQAIMTGVALGVNAISSNTYLDEMRQNIREPLLDQRAGRVRNVLVVDSEGNVRDSLMEEFAPLSMPDGAISYTQLRDILLPPLSSAVELADQGEHPPPPTATTQPAGPGEQGAFYFPVETNLGRWYVIVVLGSASSLTNILEQQASRLALYTLALLVTTMVVTGLLVWRFTRPIQKLSFAARRVAGGDFSVRVPVDRRDETGALAAAFNEMISRLGRTRELESQLHQAEKAAVVGRLASAIAHEIRNPLNYINLTLDHLRSAFAPEDPEKRKVFEHLASQLKTEVARINRHISDFLKYSRPSDLELEPLDLKAEVADALRIIEGQATECGIQTRIEEVGDVPLVMADRDSLRSVFTNLLLNGLQAMDGDGGSILIKLSGESDGALARVEISDTGRGIAPEDIAKVFEPYYSTKETGTGLGLAIVKKAIADHGGSISVHSKQDDGTTFTITLPANSNSES